jgi:hypothetical protein
MLALLDAAFESAAPSVGLPKDHLKLLTILYISVPLCAILKRLPDSKPYLKNVFNIAYLPPLYSNGINVRISLFFLVGVFDLWTALWTLVISGVGTYALTFGLRGPMMPWVVFVFVMGHLSVSQLVRQIYKVPDSIIDNTGFSLLPVHRLMKECTWLSYFRVHPAGDPAGSIASSGGIHGPENALQGRRGHFRNYPVYGAVHEPTSVDADSPDSTNQQTPSTRPYGIRFLLGDAFERDEKQEKHTREAQRSEHRVRLPCQL